VKEVAQCGLGSEAVTRALAVYQWREWAPLALHDTRGWDATSESEWAYLFDGFIGDGAALSAACAITPASTGFRKTNPTLAQRMHAVVIVVPATLASDRATVERARRCNSAAQARGIRSVLLMTHVDACGDARVAADVAAVAHSQRVRKTLSALATSVGVSATSAFATKNQTLPEIEWDSGALTWSAIAMIVARVIDSLESAATAMSAARTATTRLASAGSLGDALASVSGKTAATAAKWATQLANEDLETVNDVRILRAEALAALRARCSVALFNALLLLHSSSD
jgi:hypothetical protein